MNKTTNTVDIVIRFLAGYGLVSLLFDVARLLLALMFVLVLAVPARAQDIPAHDVVDLGGVVVCLTAADPQASPDCQWVPWKSVGSNEHPLRDSLMWGLPLAGAAAFDRHTSLYWSTYSSNCTEGNLSRRNPDGTLNGFKATIDDALTTAAFVGAVYMTKRLHWRYAEVFAKGALVGRAAMFVSAGVKSLRECKVVR